MPKAIIDSEPTTGNVVTNKSKVRKSKKSLFKVLLFVVVLAVVGFASFTISRNKALAANRPAEKALTALRENKPDDVYALGTDEFKKASDKKKVTAVVKQWNKIINEATNGKPELVSKRETTKDGKQLATLVYKYDIQPGKSKINQKELFVSVVTQKVDTDYKLYTFTIDSKVNK